MALSSRPAADHTKVGHLLEEVWLEDHPQKPGKVGWFDEPNDPKLTQKNLDVDQKTWGNQRTLRSHQLIYDSTNDENFVRCHLTLKIG